MHRRRPARRPASACTTSGAGASDGLRVYAGLRSDPFFIDLPAYLESLKTGRLAFKDAGAEQPGRRERPGHRRRGRLRGRCSSAAGTPLLGVVGETVVAGKLPIRIERFGRPEIKNVIMSMKEFDQVNRDLEIRDLYNLEDAFHMSKDYRGAYRARLNANLAAIDRLDGKTDWPLGPDGAHPLTELLLDDYLVVDVSKPFAEDSYFEIERAVLAGTPPRDVRGPLAERRRDGHPLHAAHQRRQRAAHQRRRGPGDGAGVGRLPLPGAAQSACRQRELPIGTCIARVRQQAVAPRRQRALASSAQTEIEQERVT